MDTVRKTIKGSYRASEVDRLIQTVKADYEECLREQKQRILELREENKAMAAVVSQYQANAQYVTDAIKHAEHLAKKIVEQAELKAMNFLAEAEARSHQMQAEARACLDRLLELKKTSESVYIAVCKALPENGAASFAKVREKSCKKPGMADRA